jgi:hypothetical protein
LNCGRSSKKAAVATMRGPFITNSPCYVLHGQYHATLAAKEKPCRSAVIPRV